MTERTYTQQELDRAVARERERINSWITTGAKAEGIALVETESVELRITEFVSKVQATQREREAAAVEATHKQGIQDAADLLEKFGLLATAMQVRSLPFTYGALDRALSVARQEGIDQALGWVKEIVSGKTTIVGGQFHTVLARALTEARLDEAKLLHAKSNCQYCENGTFCWVKQRIAELEARLKEAAK